jgi:hypothetical protein
MPQNFVGDIFGLTSVYDRQVLNIEQNNFINWPEYSNYGYICGGTTTPPTSFFDQLYGHDYSSSTISYISPFLAYPSSGVAYHGTVKSSDNAYIMGGTWSTSAFDTDTVRRFEFNTATVSLPGNNLPAQRNYFATVETLNYGYLVGGQNYVFPAQYPKYSTITRLDFSNETFSLPGKNLPAARNYIASISSNSYGYFGGGFSPPNINTITRLDFSNETVSDPGKNLPTVRSASSGVNNITYGYFIGGETGPPPSSICTITRLDFSNETVSNPGKNLPISKFFYTDCGNNGSTSGYVYVDVRVYRLDYSTENASNDISIPGSNLQGRNAFEKSQLLFSARPSDTYGYYSGGFFTPPPGRTCIVQRLDYSNETTSYSSNNLPSGRVGHVGTSSNSYGYFGGGFTPPYINTISRLDFSNQTVSNPGKNLPSTRYDLAATSSSSYGYFGGGGNPGLTNFISRLDFSNETVSNPGKNLPTAIYRTISTSSSSYGYFGGGSTPVYVCTISRLDFSNETVSDPGKNLPTVLAYGDSVSNNSYGYFGGGYNPALSCIITRLDFSNENVSQPGQNLPSRRGVHAGASSSFYGYFGGGWGPPYLNTISRLDFSTENVSNPASPLRERLSGLAAVSNSN